MVLPLTSPGSAIPVTGPAGADPPVTERPAAGPLGFGVHFADKMLTMRWPAEAGWHRRRIEPYRPLSLDPAALCLHYGQAVFEGLKAYRQADGGVAIFRPRENARRLNRSAARMAIPELPEGEVVEAMNDFVASIAYAVPSQPGQSLYLRPLVIAVEPTLAVRPAREYLFLLIASPVESFFASDEVRPVRAWVAEGFVRAAAGGTGEAKCPGNYAGALLAQVAAIEHGCEQVVWLDAAEHRWVEEMGAMNIFFVWDGPDGAVVTTPPLTGSLLPGVVRRSVLTLAADLGYEASEERLSVEDWRRACENGRMREMFATGTAAVVTPIGVVRHGDREWSAGDGGVGPVTARLRAGLLDVQYGRVPDRHNWLERVR
ncbi:MAG: branched-chain amino acid aminotransferase [Frankia sp.]